MTGMTLQPCHPWMTAHTVPPAEGLPLRMGSDLVLTGGLIEMPALICAEEVAYNEIKSRVLDGSLIPGTRLVHRTMAKDLGMEVTVRQTQAAKAHPGRFRSPDESHQRPPNPVR